MVWVFHSAFQANRCPHCRRSTDLRSRSVKFCPRCGEEIDPGLEDN